MELVTHNVFRGVIVFLPGLMCRAVLTVIGISRQALGRSFCTVKQLSWGGLDLTLENGFQVIASPESPRSC